MSDKKHQNICGKCKGKLKIHLRVTTDAAGPLQTSEKSWLGSSQVTSFRLPSWRTWFPFLGLPFW